MKKLLIPFFASFLLLGLSSSIIAQNSTTNKTNQKTTGRNFVDKNNDRICDNNTTGRQGTFGRNFVDKNKDGVCDNVGNLGKKACGRKFNDKNNDVICDNRGNGTRGNGNCFRNGNCKGYGYGNQNRHRSGNR